MGIDFLLFGYRRISCDEAMRPRLVSAFLNLGISAREMKDGTYAIREADFKRFKAYAGGRVRYIASEPEGSPRLVGYLRQRIYTVIGALLGVITAVFLSFLVWDVRVSGNERLTAREIEGILEEAGFGVGSFWGSVDTEHAASEVLMLSEDLAWVQINRRGTVAYVEVREREVVEGEGKPKPNYLCSNIVADRAGVIEEITVKSGVAMVKPGDVVKKGDVLIMGVISSGGTELVRAEGSVIALSSGSIIAEAGKTEEKEFLGNETLVKSTLRIFGLSLNIFKKYGNLETGCVIIENEEDYLLIGGCRLPLRIKRTYALDVIKDRVTYTDSELPGVASDRLSAMMAESLAEADLIKIKTAGSYTDDGYTLRADYVYSAEIGREVEIDLSGLGEKYGKDSIDPVG